MTLFQGALKIVASRHKCDEILPQKKKVKFSFNKKKTHDKIVLFLENCVILADFFVQRKKKKPKTKNKSLT